MKGIIRFTALVVFLGVAWVAIPMLVGRDKEPEKRLVGALDFIQNTIQYSRSVPFDVDVFDSPTIERESQPNVWSISATLTFPVRTGTVIREPYTAVVENLCQPYKERKCWRLIQLTIGDAVLGNQTGSISAALETLAPDIVRIPILDTPAINLAVAAVPGADATPGADEAVVSREPTITASGDAAETPNEAKKPAEILLSRASEPDAAGDITAPPPEVALIQPDRNLPDRNLPDRNLVVMIQSHLRDRGLNVGRLDGVMGPRTRTAIVTYQRDHGLTTDGIPSQGLLDSLRSTAGAQRKTATVGVAPPAPEVTSVAMLGDRARGAVTEERVAPGEANAGFMVELSAFATAEVTMRERKRLQVELSDLLGNIKLTVERIDLGERGVHYQVQANSFPDRLTANYMCARVRARKGFCQVVTPSSIARALNDAKTTSPAFTSRPRNSLTTTQENGKYYAHAGVRAQNSGVFGKAIEFYTKAIESDDLSRKDLARVFNNRGAAHKNLEFYDLAIDDYNTAIRLKKDYARAYYNRGIALGSKGLLDDAIKDYSTSLKLNPDDAATYNNRGLAYERVGLHKKAISDFSRAISLAPDLSYAYYNRGLAYEVANERRRAIMDFRKSYSLNPANSTYQAKMKDIGLLQ